MGLRTVPARVEIRHTDGVKEKPSNDSKKTRTAGGWPQKKCLGMSLLEVAIASFLFTLMAVSTLTAMMTARKMAENNVAQATAAIIAQGIMEQVQLVGYTPLTSNTTLPITFTGPSTSNAAVAQSFDLPWAADATTFTDIGSHSDPTDLTTPIVGVLIDVAYKNGSTVIRPARYMKMKVNLRRTVHTADDNVEIILTYSWQPPSGYGANASRYITREIRTIRSQAPSY